MMTEPYVSGSVIEPGRSERGGVAGLEALLPIKPTMRGRGRRPTENRAVLNGILWRLRCGAPWRDVLPLSGPHPMPADFRAGIVTQLQEAP